jgi:trigger factor
VNVTEEQITANHHRLLIDVKPEDYLPKVDEELKALSKRVQLDGFRKGKVPVGITRKFYGNAVLADELNKMVNDAANNFIKEKEWKLIGQLLPYKVKDQTIDIAQPDSYIFGFEAGIIPDFAMPDLKSKNFTKEKVIVTEKMIGDEIERLKSAYGERTYPDEAQETDVLSGELRELNENGEEKENGISGSSSFALDAIRDAAIKSQLLNLKKDESVSFSIHSAFENEEMIVHNILKIDHETAHGMSDSFRFTLKSIIHIEKANADQQLFDKVFGKGAIETEHDFRQKIKEELETQFDRVAVSRLKNEVQSFVLSNAAIDLPSGFLVKYFEENRKEGEQPLDEDGVQHEMVHIKWNLVAGKVQQEQHLEIKDEELRDEAEKDIRAYFRSDVYFQDRPEELKNLVGTVLKDEKSASRLYSRLLDEKVWSWMLNEINTDSKEVSEEEFYKEHHHH